MTSILGAQLPDNWSTAPLKHVTSFLNRGSAPDYIDEGSVRAVSQATNQDDGLDWTRTRFHNFTGDATKLKGYLYPHDILINSTGTGTLGRIGFFQGSPDEIPCMADSHVTIARTIPSIMDARFAFYWLRSQPFQEWIYSALTVGATNQIELNRERLASASIPVPPIGTQRRIADFLDAETRHIDRLVSIREKQSQSLKERSYAVVSEALLPGILTRSLGHAPWPWLSATTADAPLVKLGYVCEIQNGLTVDGKRVPAGDSVTRPYLRVANVQAGHVDLDNVSEITVPRALADRSTLRPGDVLMTEGGDLDKLGRGTVWHGELPDCLHQNHVFALRPNDERLLGDYLALMTQTLHGRCYFESTGSKTTNLASTNSSKILNFHLPLPSPEKQRLLCEYVQARFDEIERAKSLLMRQSALLAERRRALITAAVTGQFDVSSASGRGVEV